MNLSHHNIGVQACLWHSITDVQACCPCSDTVENMYYWNKSLVKQGGPRSVPKMFIILLSVMACFRKQTGF